MWKCISFDKKYFDEMIKMTKEYYGEIEISNKKYIEHQYFSNPKGEAIITLAYDYKNNKIAGQYVVLPKEIRVDGEMHICVNSLNTLTDKDYRGQGVFTGIAEENYRNAAEISSFCYGVPNQNSYHGFIKKLGFKDIGSIPLYLRPLLPSKMVKSYLNSTVLSQISKIFDPFFKVKPIKNDMQYDIVKINESNVNLIDDIWDLAKDKYKIMFKRDSEFFRYRYIEIPDREYEMLVATKDRKPVALIVGRITEIANMKSGIFVDFLMIEGEEKSGKLLINKLIDNFEEESVELLGCLVSENTSEAKLLRKCGFIKCPKFLEPQPFPLILRTFDNNINKAALENINNWFFTAGDYDVI